MPHLAILSTLLACGDPCASPYITGELSTVTSGELTFSREVLDAEICGPAFAAAGDLDGDGSPELVASWFGQQDGPSIPNGGLTRYDPDAGTSAPILEAADGVKWPNTPHLDDLDGDGDLDLTAGTGFLTCLIDPWTAHCGGLLGFENDGAGGFSRFDVVTPGAALFYHAAAAADLDGDGTLDLVAVGESVATPFGHADRAEAQWFRGLGDGRFEQTPRVIGEGLGSLPAVIDVDGDGDLDLVGAEYFREDAASFAWFEQTAAPSEQDPGSWTRHVIDAESGKSIQLAAIPDLFGDGETVFVGTNHVNNHPDADPYGDPMVLAYTIPDDPTDPWDRLVLADDFDVIEPGTGVGAPGIFGHGDVDGDGDADLLVSGDGDRAVYWLEQTAPGEFAQHVLEPDLTQAGAMLVVDLDGDGANELVVSGYDDNAIFVYTREGS